MHILKYLVLVIAVGLMTAACTDSEQRREQKSLFDDENLVAIYDAAYRGDTLSLATYAISEKPAYRMAYARLMGSVTPEHAPDILLDLLTDAIPYVRLYAAFAVGQIGNEKSLPALEKAFKKSTIPEIKAELLEAIGKSANDAAMEFLVTHNPNTAIEEAGKIWGVYRGMLQGKLKEEHLTVIVAHLNSNEAETRLAAANILSRQRKFGLEKFSKEIYQKAMNEANSEIQATLGYSLSGTSSAEEFSRAILSSADDPVLRSVALMILPNPKTHIELLENALISNSPWEAMTAAKLLAATDSFIPSRSTIAAARTTEIPEIAAVVAQALLKSDRAVGEAFYNHAWNRLENPVKRSVLLGVWIDFDYGLDTLKQYLFKDGPLGTAAADAYITGMKSRPGWKDKFASYTERALDDSLLAQSVIFSTAMIELDERIEISEETLEKGLNAFSQPEYIEAYQAISKALNELYGIEKPPLTIEHSSVDWDLVRSMTDNQILTLYAKGRAYNITPVVEDAPASVSNTVKLAQEGFYDGTYFHRIVPGFVSQGGGPRGDGYGSDDRIIRSEFSPLKYGKGVVGLASAGKDTESCQFFITHIPTPHLDGRYTIIGASENDFSDIETGARIDSVRVVVDSSNL